MWQRVTHLFEGENVLDAEMDVNQEQYVVWQVDEAHYVGRMDERSLGRIVMFTLASSDSSRARVKVRLPAATISLDRNSWKK